MPDYKPPKKCNPFRRPHRKPQINFYAVNHAQKVFLTSFVFGTVMDILPWYDIFCPFTYFILPLHHPLFLELPTQRTWREMEAMRESEISGNGDEQKIRLGYMTRLKLAATVSLLGFISGKRLAYSHLCAVCCRSTFRVSANTLVIGIIRKWILLSAEVCLFSLIR